MSINFMYSDYGRMIQEVTTYFRERAKPEKNPVVMGPDVICPICGTGPTMWMGCDCGATPEKAMYKSDLDALNALKEEVA